MPSPRLAIVVSHPTQYYSPWFRWMAQNGGLSLRVFYLWDAGVTPKLDPRFGRTFAWDVDLLFGYEHEFVANTAKAPTTERFSGLQNPGLTRRLARWKPDAILLFGYAYRSHLHVLWWAWRTRTPVVFRGDSHVLGRTLATGFKGKAMRALFRRFASVTFVGEANRDYFLELGVPESRLFFAPHCVDRGLFDPELPVHRERADALRTHLRLTPDLRVVLFAGKLVPSKQPRALLDAFIASAPLNVVLIFVGDGEDKAALEARAATAGCMDRTVFFLPFSNQSEMPSRYLLASLFVLPSRGVYETWGLAVNEAMEMNVPCLVSDRVGCQRDLVTDGETGWVFPAEDTLALRATLERAMSDLSLRGKEIRAKAKARISLYRYDRATAGLQLALQSALAR